jgi:hypothetical protein
MKALREVADQELTWVQPRVVERTYALQAGDEVLATLRWEKALGSLALAEAAEGRWTFKRVGLLHPRVTVRTPGAEIDLATVDFRWNGSGELIIPGGSRFDWVCLNFWATLWGFRNRAGEPLILFRPKFNLKKRGTLAIEPPARELSELPLLSLLGWYLLSLMSDDTVAATMVAATAGAT